MSGSIEDYFSTKLKDLNFIYIAELSFPNDSTYRMFPEYGVGTFRKINWKDLFFVLIADFTPKNNFVRVSEIYQNYLEISQFETESSSFKIGNKKLNYVGKGICCYVNSHKISYAYCDANTPCRFTKILITEDYYNKFLKERYGDEYSVAKKAVDYLFKNPNIPELNFIFQQIRDCKAVGTSQQIYLESKILEVLSIITHNLNKEKNNSNLNVRLDKKDIKSLKKIISFMKKNLSLYPSIIELSKIANMSTTRFQMAFKKVYGTTVYDYLKEMRMNTALILLKDSDYSIKEVSKKVGYTNSGHFAGIFKKTYGISPKEYRTIHQIR